MAASGLAKELSLTAEELAERVFRIASANMAQALRRVSVKRGYDPRDYALFPCGGAGALIATALADEVDIREIVVPPNPGVFSAVGLTVSDVRMDYVLAEGAQLASSLTSAMLAEKLESLRGRAAEAFSGLGYDPVGLSHQFTVDARYRGQGYELRVPVEEARLRGEGQAYLAECFHQEHARQYGHAFRKRDVEAISFRLTALHPRGRTVTPVSEESAALPPGDRQVLYGGEARAYPVVARTSLSPGHKAEGPLIVVEDSTSTLVPPGWILHCDDLGVLHLSRQKGASQ